MPSGDYDYDYEQQHEQDWLEKSAIQGQSDLNTIRFNPLGKKMGSHLYFVHLGPD
jgi:hypothetical protein